jgi:hypothetical protein
MSHAELTVTNGCGAVKHSRQLCKWAQTDEAWGEGDKGEAGTQSGDGRIKMRVGPEENKKRKKAKEKRTTAVKGESAQIRFV